MPLTADIRYLEVGCDEDEEMCGEMLYGHDLLEYADDIHAALLRERMPEEAERGL